MGETFDVVVIGGAVMGCSVAYWLTRMQPGLSVLVVERDPSFSQASTALSVASIRQQFTTEVNVSISRFGIGFIRNFQDSLGVDVGIGSLGLKENGYLFLASTNEGMATLAEAAAMQRALGAATELWSPDQIAERFPWLEVGDLRGGSFGPGTRAGSTTWAFSMASGLRRGTGRALRHGSRRRSGTERGQGGRGPAGEGRGAWPVGRR